MGRPPREGNGNPLQCFCLDIKMLSDDCLQLWGQCSYCFHMHNILKRLKAQQVQQSPVCPQNRKFKE